MPAAPTAPPAAPTTPAASPAPSKAPGPGQTGVPVVEFRPSTDMNPARSNSPAMVKSRARMAEMAAGKPAAPKSAPSAPTPAAPDAAEDGGGAEALSPPPSPIAPTPAAPAAPEAPKGQDVPPLKPQKDLAAPPKPGEKPIGPWAVTAKYKQANRALETQLAEAKKQLASVGDAKNLSADRERLQAELKETRDKLAFHEYREDPEFKKEHLQPLVQAWIDAEDDLKEIPYTDEDGATRPARTEDLTVLANMPLAEAKRVAIERFGDLANEVMAHRNKIVDLYRKQQRVLDEVKKTAGERRQADIAAQQHAHQEANRLLTEYSQADVANDTNLQPKEGDEEWNSTLNEAEVFVESAFFQNATNPKLSSEDRAKIVRGHANIRARAKAYPMLALGFVRLQTEVEALKKALAEYKGGEPPAGQGRGGEGEVAAVGGSIMEQSKANLRSRLR